MQKQILSRSLKCAISAGLLVCSPSLWALGLGDAHVRSYLGQPLDVRIDLISRNDEELKSVSVGLASAEDFEIIGLSRASVTVPLKFEVERTSPGAYIQVNSALPVSEPVVQVVLEVAFEGGRMLREYTLFLDPPTIASAVPMPAVTPRRTQPEPIEQPSPQPRVSASQETPALEASASRKDSAPAVETQGQGEVESSEADVREVPERAPDTQADVFEEADALEDTTAFESPVKETPRPSEPETSEVLAEPAMEATFEEAFDTREKPFDTEEEASAVTEEAFDTTEEAGEEQAGDNEYAKSDYGIETETDELEFTEELIEELEVEKSPESDEPLAMPAPSGPAPVYYPTPSDSGDRYGPVQGGETMWKIASEFSRNSEFSVNQAMLAFQALNPDAFINDNINALRRGAILRKPVLNDIGNLSKRDAMLEVMRQEQLFLARKEGREVPTIPPTIVNEPADQALLEMSGDSGLPDPDEMSVSEGHLELVPPVHESETSEQGAGGGLGTESDSDLDDEEALARAEEDLANAQQENEYLNERIRELEERLTQAQNAVNVEDTGLAEMEESLREQRLSGEAEQEITVAPPREELSWFVGKAGWLAGIVTVVVAALVFLLRRFRRPVQPGGDETVQSIRDEAEEILRLLDEDNADTDLEEGEAEASTEADTEANDGERAQPGVRPVVVPVPDSGEPVEPAMPFEDSVELESTDAEEDAVELDSNDPEVKLDLARAYIAMGDGEAARTILEEVIEQGNETQVGEAREMMTEL